MAEAINKEVVEPKLDGMYVANRTVTISTIQGHVLRFKKNEPMYVPPSVREEMLQYGILPVDDDLPIKEEPVLKADPVGEDRRNQLRTVIAALMKRNRPGDFTAGGIPTLDSVRSEVGFPVDRKEVNDIFGALKREMMAQGDPE